MPPSLCPAADLWDTFSLPKRGIPPFNKGGMIKINTPLNCIDKLTEHLGGLLNDIGTFFPPTRSQPLFILLWVIQMITCQSITIPTSKLLFELIPKFLTFFVNFRECFFILGIGSPYLHPDSHHRSGESPTK